MTAPDAQSLTYHLTCMQCHYRLRGLPEDGGGEREGATTRRKPRRGRENV